MAEERSDAGDAGRIIGNAFRHTAFMPQADAAGQPIPAATVIARDPSLEERSPDPLVVTDPVVLADIAARLRKEQKAGQADPALQWLPAGQATPAATNVPRDLPLEERSKAGDEFLDFLSGALGGFGGGGLMGRDAEPIDSADQAASAATLAARDLSLEERNALDVSSLGREPGSLANQPRPLKTFDEWVHGPVVTARDVPVEERGLGPLGLITALPQVIQGALAPVLRKQRPQTVQAPPVQPYMPYQAVPGGQVAGPAGAMNNGRPVLVKRGSAAGTAGQVIGGMGQVFLSGILGPFAGFLGGGGGQGGQQASALQIQYFSPPAPAYQPQLPPAPPASGKATRRSRVRRSDNQEPALLNPRAIASVLAALSTMSTFPGMGVAERDARGIEAAHEPMSTAVQGNFVSEGNLAKRGNDHVDSGPVFERCYDDCFEGKPIDITTSVSVAPSAKHPREAAMATEGPASPADGSLHERLVVVPVSKATVGKPSTFQTSVITRTVFKNAKQTKTSGKTSTGVKKGKKTKTWASTSIGAGRGKQTKTSTSARTGAKKPNKPAKTPSQSSPCSRTRTGSASSAPRVHGNPFRLTQSRNLTRVATYSGVQRSTVTQLVTRAKNGSKLPKTGRSTTRSGSKTAKTTSASTTGRSSSRSGSKIAKVTSVSATGRPSSRSSSKTVGSTSASTTGRSRMGSNSKTAQTTSKPSPSNPPSLNDPVYKTVTLDPNDMDMLTNGRIGVRPGAGKKSSTGSGSAAKTQTASADGQEGSLKERGDSHSHEAIVESRSDSHDPMEQ